METLSFKQSKRARGDDRVVSKLEFVWKRLKSKTRVWDKNKAKSDGISVEWGEKEWISRVKNVKTTARGIPVWSPTTVLTSPSGA